MAEIHTHTFINIPSNLRNRQLLISIGFFMTGVLWIIAPRTTPFDWKVLIFFLVLLIAIISSLLMLPRSLEFTGDKLTVSRMTGTLEIPYHTIISIAKMPQITWWGRKYPGYLIRFDRKKVLLVGFLAGSQIEDDLLKALQDYIPGMFH